MGMAEFYAPHYRTSSVTDAGGRLLGWTSQNGDTLHRVGGGVNAAGGSMNVFAYADPPANQPRRATMRRPQPPVAAASAQDQVVIAPAKQKTKRTSKTANDQARAAYLREFPARKNERWARELMQRHPSWFA